MRFISTFRLNQQITLVGQTSGLKVKYGSGQEEELSCHEFSTKNVECLDKIYYESGMATVKLIALKYASTKLFGPASRLPDGVILYPCDKNMCTVECPCNLCRIKVNHCRRTGFNETCSGDCSDCRKDCTNHLLFHRALHTLCKFCSNVQSHLPNFLNIICIERRKWFADYLTSACVLKHIPGTIDPESYGGMYLCDKCKRGYKTKSDLKRHEVEIHFGEKFGCQFCHFKCARNANLQVHIKTVHGGDDNASTITATHELQCENCSQTFVLKSNLTRHKRSQVCCTICQDRLCTTKLLQKHIMIEHSCHKCELCGKMFKTKAKLVRHKTDSLAQNDRKNNHCELCDIILCTHLDLRKHRTSTHQEKKCEYCEKIFTKNGNFKRHILNRSDMLCSKCGKVICNRVDLNMHIKNTHETKTCSICDISYCLKNYKLHMFSEHQQEVDNLPT